LPQEGCKVFGLLSGVWSVTVLIGPLIGGVFASYGHWRGAFVTVAGIGCLLGAGALFTLAADRPSDQAVSRTFPTGRIALICGAIALLSAASVATGLAIEAMLITATVVAFVLMMRTDRRAAVPLLPSDAFSLRSGTGAGLWMILLMSVGYSPLAIYAPLLLQHLHGVSPLGAGYMVALASLAWTAAALSVASLSEEWPPRLIIMGPSAMGAGLAGVGVLMAPGPVAALIPPIVLIGAGIGAAWAFVLQRVMSDAKGGEENIATGWHAIEFLLWGQDFHDDGPGDRSFTDFVDGSAPNAKRRRQYLQVVTALLVDDLTYVLQAWQPRRNNYRAQFVSSGNEAVKQADPAYDLRKDLIGNLGDDWISYQKAPRGNSAAELNSPPSLPLLSETELADIARRGAVVVDTRSAPFFGSGHFSGSLNIGLSSNLFATWVGFLVPFGKEIALVVGSAENAKKARLELARIGYDNVAGYIEAETLGRTRQLSQLGVEELHFGLRRGEAPQVLDVRTAGEWEAGHIESALHIPLPSLPRRAGGLGKDSRLAVICGSGYRSSIAASLLQAHGFSRVQNVMGGMGAYLETGVPPWQPSDLVFIGENI